MSPKGRAVLYLRVSTEDQSVGLSVQREACRAWADAQGLPVAREYVDEGRSGTLPPEKRRGLLRALRGLERGDVLVVHKRDRLARDVVVAAMVEAIAEKAGATVACADGTANGDTPGEWLARAMQDVFAQYEVMLIRLRTSSALQQKKASGLRYGNHAPYGWKHTGPEGAQRMEPDSDEQEALALARSLRGSGYTLRGVCVELEKAGHAPRGKGWHPYSVKRMLEYEPPAA